MTGALSTQLALPLVEPPRPPPSTETSRRPDAQAARKLDVSRGGGTVGSMIIAVAGQKGGSGKTTTAISIACEYLARGRRVLLVDADPQGSTSTFASVASEVGARTPTVVSMGVGLHRPEQLPALARDFDVTVIDCPPRHGEILKSAVIIADLVVLPCGPSALDAWALGASVDLINEAKVLRPDLLAVVLLTKKVARTAIGQGARDVLTSSGLPVLQSEMYHRVTYAEAPAAGLGPSVYAPTSPAAEEVRALATELELLAASTHVQQEVVANAV